LTNRITIVRNSPENAIFAPLLSQEGTASLPKYVWKLFRHWAKLNTPGNYSSHFDFVMCNPPFYASEAEMSQLAESREFSPHAVKMLFIYAI
jgi:16S rRNA G1207 methylase RsmC